MGWLILEKCGWRVWRGEQEYYRCDGNYYHAILTSVAVARDLRGIALMCEQVISFLRKLVTSSPSLADASSVRQCSLGIQR